MFFKKATFNEKIDRLKQRALIIKHIRSFFDRRDYLEVETPILQISPCMDTHIHAFKTSYKDITLKPTQDYYLHTSPEFGMKKLLSAGCEKIYQICHVFRNADNTKQHSPEFTMIEWYNTDFGYHDLMDEVRSIVTSCGDLVGKRFNWHKLSISDAFQQYADLDLDEYIDNLEAFKSVIKNKGLHSAEDDQWDDIFHRIMMEYVEPELKELGAVMLYDYPKHLAALARPKANDPKYVERFELYIDGIELANGFGELTEPEEQLERFKDEMEEKQRIYGEQYPVDYEFITALEQGLPDCSGVALGVDRLVMILTGAEHINDVLWHPIDKL